MNVYYYMRMGNHPPMTREQQALWLKYAFAADSESADDSYVVRTFLSINQLDFPALEPKASHVLQKVITIPKCMPNEFPI